MTQIKMSDPVTLDTPLKRGDKAITDIRLRKPMSGELRGLSLTDVLQLDVSALHKLLPRISDPTLTEQEVSQLDPADLVQLGTEVVGFFITKGKLEDASLQA